MPAAPIAPPSASECTWSNALDRDSFYVAADAITTCARTPSTPTCVRVHNATEDSLMVSDLAEGVGTLRFAYQTAADGTHSLIGVQLPTAGVIKAVGVPANVTLDAALSAFYTEEPLRSFRCTVSP